VSVHFFSSLCFSRRAVKVGILLKHDARLAAGAAGVPLGAETLLA
jgi:hypothetical protein